MPAFFISFLQKNAGQCNAFQKKILSLQFQTSGVDMDLTAGWNGT